MKQCLANDLRLKKPSWALEADYGNSRKRAIHLFCMECMGGSASSVDKCPVNTCPLWQFRKDGISSYVPPTIPKQEELLKLKDENTSDARREHGKKLGAMKRK
jgi:hypothetical protein